MSDQELSPLVVKQTTANLELTKRFVEELLDDPSGLDDVPEGSRIVLIPADDPELGQLNFETAVREMMQGRRVVMRLVGGLAPEAEAWKAADIRNIFMHEVKFPEKSLQASDVKIVWDQSRDTLLVDFFADRQFDVKWLPLGRHIMLRVETSNHEIVGYRISSFFQLDALRSLALLRAFRKAEIRPITDQELGEGELEIVRQADSEFDDGEAAAVATAFLTVLDPRRRRPDPEQSRSA
jgi:hypothetical protein